MKKVLKVIIITLLVIAAIVGTCFVFFKNYKTAFVPELSLIELTNSEENNKLDKGYTTVYILIVGKKPEDRIPLLQNVSNELDNIWDSLMGYYVSSNFKVKDADLNKKHEQVVKQRKLVLSMIEEFRIKSSSDWFKRDLGANDIVKASADYLVKYADLVLHLNNMLDAKKDLNKKSDLKFAMFDLYARVVKNNFSKTKVNNNKLVVVENTYDMNELNDYFTIQSSYILATEAFSSNAIKFIEYYASCKDEFAVNFASNIEREITLTNTSTSLEKTIFYFQKVYGIGR